MRYIATFVICVLLVGAGSILAAQVERLPKPHVAPAEKVAIKDTASTTENAAKFETFDMLPEFAVQATCLRMRSSADGSLLYVTATVSGFAISVTGCGK